MKPVAATLSPPEAFFALWVLFWFLNAALRTRVWHWASKYYAKEGSGLQAWLYRWGWTPLVPFVIAALSGLLIIGAKCEA